MVVAKGAERDLPIPQEKSGDLDDHHSAQNYWGLIGQVCALYENSETHTLICAL